MTKPDTGSGEALRLLVEILARYDSVEDFLAQVRCELDGPTEVLPRLDGGHRSVWADPARWPITPKTSSGSGRHARADDIGDG